MGGRIYRRARGRRGRPRVSNVPEAEDECRSGNADGGGLSGARASEPLFTGKLSLSLEVDSTGHVARTELLPEPYFVRTPTAFPRAFLACADAAAHELTYEAPKAEALVALSYALSVVPALLPEPARDWAPKR